MSEAADEMETRGRVVIDKAHVQTPSLGSLNLSIRSAFTSSRLTMTR